MICVKSLLELWVWLLDETASLELDSAALDWSASELLEYWGGTP